MQSRYKGTYSFNPKSPFSGSDLFHPEHVVTSFLDTLPSAVCWKDTKLNYQGCNSNFAEVVGLENPADVQGKTDYDFNVEEEAEKSRDIDMMVMTTGEAALHVPMEHKRPDGTQKSYLANKAPMWSDDGKVIGVISAYLDVTAQINLEDRLKQKEAALAERRRQIEEDLENAKHIQKVLMRQDVAPSPYFRSKFRYRYLDKVGGDFLSLRQVGDDILTFLIADLTGHGMSAALFMALLKHVAKGATDDVRTVPQYFLKQLDREFFMQIPNGFFTAIAGSIKRLSEGEYLLSYCGASHPAPIHCCRESGNCFLLNEHPTAVGLFETTDRSHSHLVVKSGDRLVLYTDGFLETINEVGEEFGIERLRLVADRMRHESPDEAVDEIYSAVDAFRGSVPCSDDQTVLLIDIL